MSKNNPLKSRNKQNKNYKLYKAKKQWVTACATFLLTLGTGMAVTTVTHADANATTDTAAEIGQQSSSANSSSAVRLGSHSQSGSQADASTASGTPSATSTTSNTTSNSNATSAAATSVAKSSAQPANHLAVSLATTSASDAPTVKAEDRSVYINTTFTAKELVTNVADFPTDATFSYVNNSEPNWQQVGTYNAQIVASYTQNGQTVTTGPVTVKVTVDNRMKFTINYVDDDDPNNQEVKEFGIKVDGGNNTNGASPVASKGHDSDYLNRYESVGVKGVPSDDVLFTGSDWKPLTNSDSNWLYPNYIWLTSDPGTLSIYNTHSEKMGEGEHAAVTQQEANKYIK